MRAHGRSKTKKGKREKSTNEDVVGTSQGQTAETTPAADEERWVKGEKKGAPSKSTDEIFKKHAQAKHYQLLYSVDVVQVQ